MEKQNSVANNCDQKTCCQINREKIFDDKGFQKFRDEMIEFGIEMKDIENSWFRFSKENKQIYQDKAEK